MTAQTGTRRPSFIDPAAPVFWVMAALIVLGAVVLVVQNGAALADSPVAAGMALATWAVYGLVLVAITLWVDRYDRLPAATVLGAFAWGGIAATALSSLANEAAGDLTSKLLDESTAGVVTSAVSTPLVEESLKIAGIVGLALIPGVRFRSPLGGLVLGMLVGLGFQVVEHFFYTMNHVQGSVEAGGAIVEMLLFRGIVVGLFTHVVYGGLAGAAIGYAVSRRDLPGARRAVVLLAAVALAAVIHGILNGMYESQEPSPIVFAITAVPVAVLVALAMWARRDEPRRLSPLAPDAVGRGLMTETEAEALRTGARATGGREMARRRRDQVRYLSAVEQVGPDDQRSRALASRISTSVAPTP